MPISITPVLPYPFQSMSTTEGPLTFSDTHDLAECIRGCEYIDNSRMILSADIGYTDPMEICNRAVLNLCKSYAIKVELTIHALTIVNNFISTKPSGMHVAPTTPYKFFWTCVGVVSFALAMKFQRKNPKLCHMLHISNIEDSDQTRRYYRELQIHVLTAINWKLFFPSAMDIMTHLSLPAFNEIISHMISIDSVNFIICFAYSDYDLLPYSSYCIAISSIAADMRHNTKSDSFYGVFFLLSISDAAMDDIAKCSELIYQKLKAFPYYSGN